MQADAPSRVPALACVEVRKAFAHARVLDGVSFAIERGEALGLVGVNGAGKTTLMRGLLDLSRIDSGTITVFGAPHTATGARAHLAYLPERFVPPAFATGAEIIRHLLALHALAYDPEQALLEARALDLDTAALARPAREYSKGMAQKLGLIACLLAGRPLLILDEPMSGLDPKARALVKRRLAALKRAGTTLFFSTHLLVDVESLCDRLIVLHRGRVGYAGTPEAFAAGLGAATLEDAFLALIERD